MKTICVVLQSTACSSFTSSSTAVGVQSGAQSTRQRQPLAAQRIGRRSWNQRLQQMILFSDISSCRGRPDGAMHQPLAVVDNPQRSCGRRRASRCRPLTKRGMSMLLTCLSYSSISCTHGMPVKFTMNGNAPRSSSAASPHEVKAARARARARAAKKASARPIHGGERVRTHPECLCGSVCDLLLTINFSKNKKCHQPLAVNAFHCHQPLAVNAFHFTSRWR